jgi:hypothetical protein
MIKKNGKEYPVSFFKLVLADEVADRVDYIRDRLGLKNNIEAFTQAINNTYNYIKTMEKAIEEGEAENKEVIDGTKSVQ